MPHNRFDKYLNFGAHIEQSSDGIALDRLSIGSLSFSGAGLPLAARLVDLLLPDKQASSMLESVRELRSKKLSVVGGNAPPDVKGN